MKELSIVLDRYNRVISPNGLGDGAWGNTPRLGARPGNFLSVKRALFAVNHSSASNDVPGDRDRQSVALSPHAHWFGYSLAVMFGPVIEL